MITCGSMGTVNTCKYHISEPETCGYGSKQSASKKLDKEPSDSVYFDVLCIFQPVHVRFWSHTNINLKLPSKLVPVPNHLAKPHWISSSLGNILSLKITRKIRQFPSSTNFPPSPSHSLGCSGQRRPHAWQQRRQPAFQALRVGGLETYQTHLGFLLAERHILSLQTSQEVEERFKPHISW